MEFATLDECVAFICRQEATDDLHTIVKAAIRTWAYQIPTVENTDTVVSKNRVQCPYCDKDFASRGGLTCHLKRQPSRPNVKLCAKLPSTVVE